MIIFIRLVSSLISLCYIGLRADILSISQSIEGYPQSNLPTTPAPHTKPSVVFVTLPKCGTHLLKIILMHPLIKDQYASVNWIHNHLIPSMEGYREDPKIKKILLIKSLY